MNLQPLGVVLNSQSGLIYCLMGKILFKVTLGRVFNPPLRETR